MTNSVRADSEVQENSTIPDPISVLTDYAMCVAHERELRVTGHPHDENLALQNFQAAVRRAFRTKVRYKTRTTIPNSLAQTSLAAFCRGMKDHVNSEDMCNAMMWFLGIEEIEPEEAAQGRIALTPVAAESGCSGSPDTLGTLRAEPLDRVQCKAEDKLYVKSFGSEVKFSSDDALEKALQVFENRERGIPQARIAASLVAELRSTLSEAKSDQKVAVEQCLETGKTFRALRRVVTLLLEARHTLSPEDHELRDRIDQLLQNGTD